MVVRPQCRERSASVVIPGAIYVFAALLHVRRYCPGRWQPCEWFAAMVERAARNNDCLLQNFSNASWTMDLCFRREFLWAAFFGIGHGDP